MEKLKKAIEAAKTSEKVTEPQLDNLTDTLKDIAKRLRDKVNFTRMRNNLFGQSPVEYNKLSKAAIEFEKLFSKATRAF